MSDVMRVNQATPSVLREIVANAIRRRVPVLITGRRGGGKSDIAIQAAADAGIVQVLDAHPAIEDATDSKGIPMPSPDGTSAAWLPFGTLRALVTATEPTLLRVEDLGQASSVSVQGAYMQMFLARRIGEHVFPDCVSFVATTNLRTERAGVSGILTPLLDRCIVVELTPSSADWCAWGIDSGLVSAEGIAFARLREELLYGDDSKLTGDMVATPSPRSWVRVERVLEWGMSANAERVAIAGCVGDGAAVERLAFRRMFRELPSVDVILANPRAGDIPQRPDINYAVVTALAARVNMKTFPAIAVYAERLMDSGHGEFAALLLRDCIRRNGAVVNTADFVKLATDGELAAMIGAI